jgi:hypothetical protein
MSYSDIIATAIIEAHRQGFNKPHDVATFVAVAIDQAGYRIVRKPKRSAK